MNFTTSGTGLTTSGIEPYVNSCDKSYAEEQMAKWRAWKNGKKIKLRGEGREKPVGERTTVKCETCGNAYSILQRTLKVRRTSGAKSLCRSCVGRLGAEARHRKKHS